MDKEIIETIQEKNVVERQGGTIELIEAYERRLSGLDEERELAMINMRNCYRANFASPNEMKEESDNED